MNILLIEPFYSGSHKHFADQLKKYSQHKITLLTHEGKFWKWRMYGAAVTLGHQFIQQKLKPDLILATDMLDVTVFLSIVRRHLSDKVPVVTYFHENQMAYPWREDSEDKRKHRDLHFGMMNYQTALASDHILFNSTYNMESFYTRLGDLLKKMPDHKHPSYLKDVQEKSSVMPLGLDLNQLPRAESKDTTTPLILWNHRWEHDKNPEDFFKALAKVKGKGIPFRLAVVGEHYKSMPKIFEEVPDLFKDELIHYGYSSYEDYIKLLNQADLLPVTSTHEFFGISVMEAIHCGAKPLLPKRLSYVELYDPQANPDLFYDSQKDLVKQLTRDCHNFQPASRDQYQHLTNPYDWSVMINRYDSFFDEIGMD